MPDRFEEILARLAALEATVAELKRLLEDLQAAIINVQTGQE